MTKITKGYKFRIYPNKEQCDLLVRSFGHTRFIYNQLLAKAINDYNTHKENNTLVKPDVSGYSFVKQLPALKAEYSWLYEVSAVALQQKALDLGRAFTNFFNNLKKNKISYPRFKKKSSRQSFTLMKTGFQIKDNALYIVRSNSPIKVNWSRDLPSDPSSCTISKDPDGSYYVSFICEVDPHLTYGTKQTGVDLGITDFAILSDGERIANNKFLINALKALKRAQQSLSRKTKGSKNRNKAILKVAKLHKKVVNQRNDFLHKLSRRLVNENQVLAIESLNVSGMIRNRHLARSISDVGWSRFVDYLSYKAIESHHCSILMMHKFYPSSKLCSVCHTKYEGLKLSERVWTCVACHTTHDRDLNASMNIRDKGLATFNRLSPNGVWINKLVLCDNELV